MKELSTGGGILKVKSHLKANRFDPPTLPNFDVKLNWLHNTIYTLKNTVMSQINRGLISHSITFIERQIISVTIVIFIVTSHST